MQEEHQKYSAEWIQQQVETHGHTKLMHHDCSLCGEWVKYLFHPEYGVGFDSSCGCVAGGTPIRRASYEEIAEWLARQESDEIRDKILERLA